MSKDQEDYLTKDVEIKSILQKLWRKFNNLSRDFSIAYAKAVNEII